MSSETALFSSYCEAEKFKISISIGGRVLWDVLGLVLARLGPSQLIYSFRGVRDRRAFDLHT